MELRGIRKLADSRPTGLLYHYTTMAGVLGIVPGKKIWASHIKYLNDSTEFELAKQIGVEVATSRRNSASGADIPLWADIIRGVEGAGINICVASFSEEGDQLSQWRGYASPGGCSLGFDHAFLTAVAEQDGWRFLPCVYDPDEQRSLMGEILDEIFEANAKVVGTPDYLDFNGGDATARINQLAGIFKHPTFVEEREWRLLSRPLMNVHPDFKLRPGASMLVPYFEKSLTDAEGAMLLRRVIAAPTPHPELACSAIRQLIVKQQFEFEVKIEASKIPFRNW